MIADYPGSPYEVGQILDSDLGKLTAIYTIDEQGNMTNIGAGNLFELYPHLFRKMKWWEKRTEEEMPRYVKLAPKGIPIGFFKVSQWGEENRYIRVDNGNWEDTIGYLPATEAEYKGEGR